VAPVFIVEGRAEQKIVQILCPGAKVMILECNGDHVALSAIAKKVVALTKACGNRHHPVVVQFDREKRQNTAEQIESELLSELENLGQDRSQFRVGISDRDLETWILYAVDPLGDVSPECEYSNIDEHEGKNGEYYLRNALSEFGESYHKTTSGVAMFSKIRASKLAEKSSSFRRFFSTLDLDCYWLSN
jgi:hypothetical protein